MSPILANIYLNDLDRMLEKAQAVTRRGKYTHVTYARYADDLVVLVDGNWRCTRLWEQVQRRVYEEIGCLDIAINEEKTRRADLERNETFSFLGFEFRRVRTRHGRWGVLYMPHRKARMRLYQKLKAVFRGARSRPVQELLPAVNPILRGWVNYFRIGNSTQCFNAVREWVEKKVRRHLMRARLRRGYGWQRWSKAWLYDHLGLHSDYGVCYYRDQKAAPSGQVT